MSRPDAGHVVAEMTGALTRRGDELADRMLARLVEEIPHYRSLDAETTQAVRSNTSEFIARCLEAAQERRGLSAEELAPFAASARRRARAGWPLSAILHAYRLSFVTWWDGVRTEVTRASADLDAALDLASVLMRLVDEVQSAVAEAFLDEAQQLSADEDRRHSQLTTTIVTAGRGAPELDLLAERAQVRLAAEYVVVVLSVPDEQRAHTRLAQVVRGLHRDPSVIATARTSDVLVLWPSPGAATEAELGRALAPVEALHPRLVAVVARPRRGAYGPALEEAERLLPLAARRGPGLHRLEDLPLEAMVWQVGGRTSAAVRSLLTPLDTAKARQSDLLGTLRAFLDCDGSPSRTAAALHVHPNTVAYRLDAVRTATGVDPRRWRDALLLLAALELWDGAVPARR